MSPAGGGRIYSYDKKAFDDILFKYKGQATKDIFKNLKNDASFVNSFPSLVIYESMEKYKFHNVGT